MSTKAERRAAREAIASFHEEQLGQLVEHVAGAVDAYRAGEQDAFDVDAVIFQFSRAAKELWKFCNLGTFEITAAQILRGDAPRDWWDRGEPRRR